MRFAALLALLLSAASQILAADPTWWSAPDYGIWSGPPAQLDHTAPANVGQLKHVAAQAARYFDDSLASRGGAGFEVMLLVDSFTAGVEDFFPANLGQLKYIAAPFYKRLHDVGLDLRPQLLAHVAAGEAPTFSMTLDAQVPPRFPWDPSITTHDDAPVTVGQLKLAFSFDLEGPLAFDSTDDNGNGIADGEERWNASAAPPQVGHSTLPLGPPPVYRPDDFRSKIEIQSGGRHSLNWSGMVNRLYQIESSADLVVWHPESSLYLYTVDARVIPTPVPDPDARSFSYHFLTYQSTEPPASQPPPDNIMVSFALRQVAGSGDWFATWTGDDGGEYIAQTAAPDAALFPPQSHDAGDYKISVFQLPSSGVGASTTPTASLPVEEAGKLAALNSIIPALDEGQSASTASTVAAGSERFWRVREIVDSDGDGLTDDEEIRDYLTDPLRSDTDGDGTSDGDEVNEPGRNPMLAADGTPATFRIDWQKFESVTGVSLGIVPDWPDAPPLNLYHKMVNTTTSTVQAHSPAHAPNTKDERFYSTLIHTLEVLDGGRFWPNPQPGLLDQMVRQRYDYTCGAPAPSDAVLANPGSWTNGRQPWAARYRSNLSNIPYNGTWLYSTDSHEEDRFLSSLDDWDYHPRQVNHEKTTWTQPFGTATIQNRQTETELSFPQIAQGAPGASWGWVDTDRAQSGAPGTDYSWKEIQLSQQATHAGLRAKFAEANYDNALVSLHDDDDLLQPPLPDFSAQVNPAVPVSHPGGACAYYVQDFDGSQKIQRYSFRVERESAEATGAATITWLETFYPADDPATPANEGLSPPEYHFRSVPRQANQSSSVYTIDLLVGKFSDTTEGPALGATVVELVPFDIEGHQRGTINSPGAKVLKGSGEYRNDTVMMENADSESAPNSTASDYTLTGNLNDHRKGNDDDLVKVVLRWPKDMKIQGVKLELKHKGLEVDATKTTDAEKYKEIGESRLNFYKPDGTKLTGADLKIDDLGSPGNGYLAEILTTGELTLFIEGAENFGMVGNDPKSRTAAQKMGGAILNFEVTHNGTTSRVRLLVNRGGFLLFHQPSGQPGALGTLEFRDGKGRITNTEMDNGQVLATWSVKSGLTTGANYDVGGGNGHTPPGWYLTYERTDFSGTQRDTSSGTGRNKKIKQGSYVRWKQDDQTDPNLRYTTTYLYDASKNKDWGIGEPTTIRFKWQMEVIPPTSAANRSAIQIHPDGKQNGTAGCIGIQTYGDCVDVLQTLTRYNALKVKVVTE